MDLIRNFKKIMKKSLNFLGYDIIRIEKSPQRTLLGLKNIPIKTILDVGANEGQFAKYISDIFPEAQLYCFEPLPVPFEKLKIWAEKKKNGKINIYNLALGEKEEEVEMYLHVEHSPSSSILKVTDLNEAIYPFVKSQKIVKVKMTTLDKWLSELPDKKMQKFRNILLQLFLIKIKYFLVLRIFILKFDEMCA